MSKENSPNASPGKSGEERTISLKDCSKLLAEVMSAFAPQFAPKPEQKKVEKPLDYLRPEFKPDAELTFWKPKSNNRFRYRAALDTLTSLLAFQENHMAPAEETPPETVEDWNKSMAGIRDELEKIMAAEISPHGWAHFADSAKKPRFSNPELAKQFEESTKVLREKDAEERKSKGRSAAVFRPRPRPAASGFTPRAQQDTRSFGSSKPKATPTTRCYNCQGMGHFGFQCNQPDKRAAPCAGFWDSVKEDLKGNEALSAIVDDLRDTVFASKATSTTKAYTFWERKFREFCNKNNLSVLPASDVTVALFVKSLGKSSSSAVQAVAAIKWLHEREMETDPTSSALIRQLLQAEKRAAVPQKHKEPATIKHLEAIKDYYLQRKTPARLRTLTMAVLAYTGCMRIDDFRCLNKKHIILSEDKLVISLPRSKTDQHADGAVKVIPRGPIASLCPVNIMKAWLSVIVSNRPDSPLFPMLTCANPRAISAVSFRDELGKAIAGSGLPAITPHSFRAGFATSAINSGVSMPDLKSFGLWESEISVNRYVKRSEGRKAITGQFAWGKHDATNAYVSDSSASPQTAALWKELKELATLAPLQDFHL